MRGFAIDQPDVIIIGIISVIILGVIIMYFLAPVASLFVPYEQLPIAGLDWI